MIALLDTKNEAIKLRKQGLSVNDIADRLKKPKSSISYWVRGTILTDKQKRFLDSRNPVTNKKLRDKAIARNSTLCLDRRKGYQEEGRKLVKNKDSDFIAGIMLYWAEGARTRNRNSVKFSNTDIYMIKFFSRFLKKYFNVVDNEISIKIHCWINNGISLEEIEKHWITELNLHKDNLRKAYIEQKRKISGKRKNVHIYGVCSITVNRTDIIQKIYGAIQEYIGFEKPEWVV